MCTRDYGDTPYGTAVRPSRLSHIALPCESLALTSNRLVHIASFSLTVLRTEAHDTRPGNLLRGRITG